MLQDCAMVLGFVKIIQICSVLFQFRIEIASNKEEFQIFPIADEFVELTQNFHICSRLFVASRQMGIANPHARDELNSHGSFAVGFETTALYECSCRPLSIFFLDQLHDSDCIIKLRICGTETKTFLVFLRMVENFIFSVDERCTIFLQQFQKRFIHFLQIDDVRLFRRRKLLQNL